MKRYFSTSVKLLGVLAGLMLCSQDLSATHFMGVDIYYECIGPSTYRIFYRSYFDCTGTGSAQWVPISNPTSLPPAPTIDLTGSCGINLLQPTPINNWTFVGWGEVTPICPSLRNSPPGSGYPTGCDNTVGTEEINGTAEVIYYRDYDFSNVSCQQYTIEWDNCCRNFAITSGAADNGIYNGFTTIDLSSAVCNSSPQFVDTVNDLSRPPIAYICEGQTTTFNQGAIDLDGDSLSYELGPCYERDIFSNSVEVVDYDVFNNYSPTSPLGPTWTVQIDPVTGDITFTPSPGGAVEVGIICIVVKEWRNGVQIGQVVRDMQVTVLANCASQTPTTPGISNVTLGPDRVPAGNLSFSEVRTCAGSEMCFDIPVNPSAGLIYSVSWDRTIPGATFTDANNPAITDTVSGAAPTARFCWTPPDNLTGTFSFVVTISDDACPLPGITQFTVLIFLEENQANTVPFADTLGCNQVAFSLAPSALIPGPYSSNIDSVSWFGNGNLDRNPNRSDTAFTHFYPGPGNYFYNVLVVDTFGCETQLTGSVIIPEYATEGFAGSDITICSNQPYQLGLPDVPDQTYSWSPTTFLDDPTLAQPTFSFVGAVDSIQVFEFVVETEDSLCRTVDYVDVTVNPSVEVQISPPAPIICIGDSITLTATANLGANTTYLWSNGATTPSIRVGPTDNTSYSVVAFGNGCVSNATEVPVQVNVGPQATISGDLMVCPNGGGTLVASGGVSYLWSVGGFTQPTIALSGITGDTTISVVAFDAQGCPGLPTSVVVSTHPSPVAAFFAPNECVGTEITFVDNSTVTNGDIGAWIWDFGDGGMATGRNPRYTYETAGTYTATLTVRTANGCEASTTQQIIVFPQPAVDFTATNVCEGGINQFESTTTIPLPGSLGGYVWSFGDGSTIDGNILAQHQYTQAGFYNVTLLVRSNDGCEAQFAKTVFVHPLPTADFDVANACEDSLVQFIDQSTVADRYQISEWLWDFDIDDPNPNTNSTDQNPTYSYPDPGQYPISLTVRTDSGCEANLVKPVTIFLAPSVDFVYDQTCENELTLFTGSATTDPATPVTRWTWGFGEGTRRAGPSLNQESFAYGNVGPGTYRVFLAIETASACKDSAFKDIVINPAPIPNFGVSRECLFDSTSFSDSTTLASGSIFEWEYQFGDGQRTFEPSPNHFYFEPGTYQATLITTSDSGCTNQFSREVVVDPIPSFSTLTGDSICFSAQARMVAVSDPGSTVRWYTELGADSAFNEGFSFITTSLPFTTTYFVEATSDQGCVSDRIPLTAFVYEDADMTITASETSVELPNSIIEFNLVSNLPITDYAWNFGDDFTSNAPAPIHEYEFAGIYEVRLAATDLNGCDYTLSEVIEVRKVDGIYTPSAFSPNGDGRNDLFRVGTYQIENFQIKVFNRWGQLVFESQNPDFSWDGTTPDGSMIKEGVYVYTVIGFDINGNEISDTRTLTVIR